MIHGEGANLLSAAQADRRAKENTGRSRANQEKRAEIADRRAAIPHLRTVAQPGEKVNCFSASVRACPAVAILVRRCRCSSAVSKAGRFGELRVWRCFFAWLALLLSQFLVRAAPTEQVRTVSVHGEKYVSLEEWGRAQGFSFNWDKPNKLISVNSRWAKLTFQVNSKRATLNGLSLWLSSPVNPSGNAALMSQRDLQKTILPILYPAKMPKNKRIQTVMIAPGHGGKDPGYQINKEQEKKYTLLMSQALKQALVSAGFKVVLTRETDTFVDLGEQAVRANRAGADLFINLHYNAAGEVDANGVETYCLTPAGATSTNGGSPVPKSAGHRQDAFNPLLAFQIHKALTSNCAFQDRGIRRAAFQVLREIDMPGVLIEGGFLSNPRDAQKILNGTQRSVAAQAIVDGILSYKRLVERR